MSSREVALRVSFADLSMRQPGFEISRIVLEGVKDVAEEQRGA